MTKSSMQAEPKQLTRLQREVLDTLCIENCEIKRSPALTRRIRQEGLAVSRLSCRRPLRATFRLGIKTEQK